MIDYLIHFFKFNKIYLITGVVLLLLIIIPTKEKISPGTKKALYICAAIWVICFAYRVGTGNDIRYLFNSEDDYHFEDETRSPQIKGSPFSKYYSNESGRKSK